MGPWEEQCVTLTWEGESYGNNTRDTISVTPDEVEKLFKKGLVTNVVRGENGKLYEKWCYADNCQYEGAIVCGILSPTYKERAIKLEEFQYINVYILSKEDIAVSKIIRLAKKDIEDLNQIVNSCDKTVLNNIIREILNRNDLFESKKKEFEKKLKIFKEMYNV